MTARNTGFDKVDGTTAAPPQEQPITTANQAYKKYLKDNNLPENAETKNNFKFWLDEAKKSGLLDALLKKSPTSSPTVKLGNGEPFLILGIKPWKFAVGAVVVAGVVYAGYQYFNKDKAAQ